VFAVVVFVAVVVGAAAEAVAVVVAVAETSRFEATQAWFGENLAQYRICWDEMLPELAAGQTSPRMLVGPDVFQQLRML